LDDDAAKKIAAEIGVPDSDTVGGLNTSRIDLFEDKQSFHESFRSDLMAPVFGSHDNLVYGNPDGVNERLCHFARDKFARHLDLGSIAFHVQCAHSTFYFWLMDGDVLFSLKIHITSGVV
jgi:hypothetical protein